MSTEKIVERLNALVDAHTATLTGSRAILGKTDRDYDYICSGRPEAVLKEFHFQKIFDCRRGECRDRFPPYRDKSIDEVWTYHPGPYDKKVDVQVCLDEWSYAEKCCVNDFLRKHSEDYEFVSTYIPANEIWDELLFREWEPGGMDKAWKQIMDAAQKAVERRWMNNVH